MKPEEIDQFFSQKIAELDDVMPPTDWNPEATFYKIQNKMKPVARRRFLAPWYLSVAASVSLVTVIATSVYFNFSSGSEEVSIASFIEEKTEKSLSVQQYISEAILNDEKTPEIVPDAHPEIVSISSRAIYKRKAYSIIPDHLLEEFLNGNKNIPTIELPCIDVQAPETVASKMVKKKTSFALSHPLKKDIDSEISENALQMNLMAGVGYVADNVAPIVQLETRLLTTNQNSQWNTYGGGLSVEGFISKSEEGMNGRPHVFAEISTGKMSKNEDKTVQGKGWSMGILLNPQEGSTMGRDTFRLRYTWEFKNRIRVSPELLVSDGFQRIYPGIRITRG